MYRKVSLCRHALRCAAFVVGLHLAAVHASASGSWTITTKADWDSGSRAGLDTASHSGSIVVLRNISDEFAYAGGNFDPMPLPWIAVGGNGHYERTSRSGYFRLVTSSPPSHWWFSDDWVPKLFQAVDGDFSIEAAIDCSAIAAHNYAGAWIFISQDSYNWYSFGIQIQASGGFRREARATSGASSLTIKNVLGSNTGVFKITRQGSLLTPSYLSGTTWIAFAGGGYSASWTPTYAGIYQYDEVTTNSYSDFDYVHFSTTRTAAASGSFRSGIIDLGVTPTAAGAISWAETVPIGASTAVATRSSADGIGWSAWSAPYGASAGSPITSPLNRYIQFSATLIENGSLQSPQIDSVTVTFPGIPPKSPVVSSSTHPGEIWSLTATAQMQWSMPADNPAPVWAYYYAIDAAAASGTSPAVSAVRLSSTVTAIPVGGLSEGEHEFRIVAQGDPNEYPLSPESLFMIRKDTLPPDPPAITSPTHPTSLPSGDDSPAFSFLSADSVSATTSVSDVAGFNYALDQSSGSVPSATATFAAGNPANVSYSGLVDGAWWMHARARDGAGNLGATSHYPITIAYHSRVSVQISSPTHVEGAVSENNSPLFELSLSNPDGATIIGYEYVLDDRSGTLPTSADTFTTAGELRFTGLRNQAWWLHVSAKNTTGTMTTPTQFGFTVNFNGHVLEEQGVHAVPSPIRTRMASIRYDLHAPAQEVSVEMLDPEGRKLSGQAGSTAPGVQVIQWDTQGLANGVYFCRIKVRRQDGKVESVLKKIPLVR